MGDGGTCIHDRLIFSKTLMGRFVPVPTLNQTVLKEHLLMCVKFQLRWINLPFVVSKAD